MGLLLALGIGLVAVGMAVQFKLSKSYQLGGKTFSETGTLDADFGVPIEKSLAAAKTGTLTVRTDNDTGSLTMTAGHGITTGARLDVYWTVGGVPGCRRGMTVGTVATNVVPIDGGAGDNLPIAASAITAMVPAEVDVGIDGDQVQAIAYYGAVQSAIVLTDGSDVELTSRVFTAGPQSDAWYTGNGQTNPLAGDTVAKVYLSHADSTAARVVRLGLAVNG